MASERHTQSEIRLALGRVPGLVLFRVNVGQAWTGETVERHGDTVILHGARRFGTGVPPGYSDLTGWRTVVVTPDMVGKPVAIFTGLEVKAARGRVTPEQENFISRVNAAGGRAGVARSVEDAARIVLLD